MSREKAEDRVFFAHKALYEKCRKPLPKPRGLKEICTVLQVEKGRQIRYY